MLETIGSNFPSKTYCGLIQFQLSERKLLISHEDFGDIGPTRLDSTGGQGDCPTKPHDLSMFHQLNQLLPFQSKIMRISDVHPYRIYIYIWIYDFTSKRHVQDSPLKRKCRPEIAPNSRVADLQLHLGTTEGRLVVPNLCLKMGILPPQLSRWPDGGFHEWGYLTMVG